MICFFVYHLYSEVGRFAPEGGTNLAQRDGDYLLLQTGCFCRLDTLLTVILQVRRS